MSADSAIHSLAGAAGGIIAMCSTYPLVFLSTRAAVENKNEGRPLLDVIKDIIHREGISGLYSGLNSSLLGIALTNGVYYYVYERSRGVILRRQGTKALSTLESILAGLIAGSVTTFATNPVWVIQTSQAVHTMETPRGDFLKSEITRKPSFLKTLRSIIDKDGVQALWRGIGPALVLVLNPVIQYTVFEQLKNLLIRRRTSKLRATAAVATVAVLNDWDFFLLGALSKLIATATTYPYIVIKSRLQTGSASAQRYKSSIDGLITVLREEGIAGLYKGIGSKLTQSVLTAAILFAVQRRLYELTKKALRTTSSGI